MANLTKHGRCCVLCRRMTVNAGHICRRCLDGETIKASDGKPLRPGAAKRIAEFRIATSGMPL